MSFNTCQFYVLEFKSKTQKKTQKWNKLSLCPRPVLYPMLSICKCIDWNKDYHDNMDFQNLGYERNQFVIYLTTLL